jgi:hypothetical protein
VANNCIVYLACPSGGVLQAVATNNARPFPSSLLPRFG